jgi:acetolactate synthase small subunit
VLDPASDGFIIELTASEAEIDKLIEDLGKGAEIAEVVRSGALGINRPRRASRSRKPVG